VSATFEINLKGTADRLAIVAEDLESNGLTTHAAEIQKGVAVLQQFTEQMLALDSALQGALDNVEKEVQS